MECLAIIFFNNEVKSFALFRLSETNKVLGGEVGVVELRDSRVDSLPKSEKCINVLEELEDLEVTVLVLEGDDISDIGSDGFHFGDLKGFGLGELEDA